MNELEFNSRRSNSSARSSGTGAMIFLILFATPFAGFGLFALINGLKKLVGGDAKNGIPLCIFGLIFSTVGFGLMIGAIIGRKKIKQEAELKARYPDKPWMTRPDWAAGKIKSSAMAQSYAYLFMGIMFTGIGGMATVFGLPEVWQKHNYAALLVLLFPVVGIGLLLAFLTAWRSQRRFGDCYFELAQIPVPVGGVLEGMIETGHPLALEKELDLKLSCVRRVVTGSGKNRNTSEFPLWQNEKVYSPQASLSTTGSGQTGIPVHFKLPGDQPECYSQGNESVVWRLEAKSKMHGPGFRALFELPVYKVAGMAAADMEDADPTATLQEPAAEIRRNENSQIKISDGPEGREFYFPPARNLSAAFMVTAAFLVWSGIFYVLLHSHAPIIFPIFWGATDAVIAFGVFTAWFKYSHVTINSTNVRTVAGYLLFRRTRQFNAGDIARFATRTGMQSGNKVYTDIRLILRGSDEKFAAREQKPVEPENVSELTMERMRAAAGPSGMTVGSGIASAQEAEWLVAEMNKALGRKQ